MQEGLCMDTSHNGRQCRHIHHGTGTISHEHPAFQHLQSMRNPNIIEKSIDQSGNFVDAEPRRHLQQHAGRSVGPDVSPLLATTAFSGII